MDPRRDGIIVKRLHCHWFAWFGGKPRMAFETPAKAVDRQVVFVRA
jgi:hypothetical protein